MKDREKKKKAKDFNISQEVSVVVEEEANLKPVHLLIKELGDLLKFVNENKECVEKVVEEEMNKEAGIDDILDVMNPDAVNKDD